MHLQWDLTIPEGCSPEQAVKSSVKAQSSCRPAFVAAGAMQQQVTGSNIEILSQQVKSMEDPEKDAASLEAVAKAVANTSPYLRSMSHVIQQMPLSQP